MFVLSALAVVAVLAWFAIRINRDDRHPGVSAALWILVFVLLAWTGLIWLVGA